MLPEGADAGVWISRGAAAIVSTLPLSRSGVRSPLCCKLDDGSDSVSVPAVF